MALGALVEQAVDQRALEIGHRPCRVQDPDEDRDPEQRDEEADARREPHDEDDEPGRAESEREQEVDGALDRQHRADGTHGRAREWCGCPYSFLDDVRRPLREAPGDPRRRPSRGTLTEDDINKAMREIRLALLEADVNFQVVKEFTAKVKERALGSRRARHAEPRPAGREDRQRGAHRAHGRRRRPG